LTSQLETLAQTVFKRLFEVYGLPVWRQPLQPIDELVSTILSQNTNDRNRDLAYRSLRRLYPTWEAVRDAPEEGVVAAVRIAGLGNQKGPRIQDLLRQITIERGSLDLRFLQDLSVEEARTWLLRFKGVGPKTAAIVLQFSLGKPSFAVDTHIYRVSGRLNLRPERMSIEETHFHLGGLFRPDEYGTAHLNLIRLGREVCHARKPDCPACFLEDICPTGIVLMGPSLKIL
jgi:endonuclease-3